jgi:hypothetical protein
MSLIQDYEKLMRVREDLVGRINAELRSAPVGSQRESAAIAMGQEIIDPCFVLRGGAPEERREIDSLRSRLRNIYQTHAGKLRANQFGWLANKLAKELAADARESTLAGIRELDWAVTGSLLDCGVMV